MKVITLGTSHGNSTFCRFNTSTMYQTSDGSLYLIDAGAPVEALIRRAGYDVQNIRATFITHLHDDHAGGLSGLIKQITKYPSKRAIGPMPLFLPEESAISALKGWIFAVHEPADSPLIDYRAVVDGVIYEDDNIQVTSHRTQHLRTKGRCEGDPCSFAYEIYFKGEGKRVLHTGDLTADLHDFPTVLFDKDFDLCVCEATHYPPELGAQVLGRGRMKNLLFIHIYDRWHKIVGPAWQMTDGESELLSYYRGLKCPVLIAHDGDEFCF